MVQKAEKYEYIILYGAGMVGELTCKRLLAHGLKKKIVGFAVTKKMGDSAAEDGFCGFRVYQIEELEEYRKEAFVIVTTLPNLHEEIRGTLLGLQFESVAAVTEGLYRSLEQNHVWDFQKKNRATFPEDSKTKILFMASDNNRTSGAFLCMAELCGMLLEHGVSVLVVLPQCGTGEELLIEKGVPYTFILSRDWAYETAKDGDAWEKLKFAYGLMRNNRAKGELIRLMKEQKVDLVHCNTTYTYIGAAAAKRCGIPFVWHLRENLENQGYHVFAFLRAFKLLQAADRIIAVSDYIRDIMPFPDDKRPITIYDAVEMSAAGISQRDVFCRKTVHMIQVGLVAPYKGQRELIEACRILKNRDNLEFRLLVVGKGKDNYLSQIQEVVKSYGLQDYITFYGASGNVAELYKEADISFMCGEKEAYGRVTVESQLSGCLMIGVNAGGTAELIRDGETGHLYEPGNPEGLADKIMAAVNNPEASRKIARAGQEYALKSYTKERNLQKILDIYEEVLGRKV